MRSSTFDKNGRLERGRQLLRQFGSRLAFFSRGLTRACLKHYGTTPHDKDLLTISVTIGVISSKQLWRRGVWIGSRSQDFFGISWNTSFTQSFVISLNSTKGVPESSTVSQGNGLSGSRLLLISSILWTKNSLKLSGRDSGGMFEGRTVPLNVPIIWLLRRKSFWELSQSIICSQI